MAVRKRFSPAERALLALGPGTRIEWRNVSQWHPATITDPAIRTDDGWQSASGTNEASTARLSPGQQITLSPGCIRAASVTPC